QGTATQHIARVTYISTLANIPSVVGLLLLPSSLSYSRCYSLSFLCVSKCLQFHICFKICIYVRIANPSPSPPLTATARQRSTAQTSGTLPPSVKTMYPYPQRPGVVSQPPTAFTTPQQRPPSAYVPPPPPVAAPNFNLDLYSMPSGSVTALRLRVSEDVRLEPPVPVSSSLLPSSLSAQATPIPDLSLERQLLEGSRGQGEAAAAGSSSNAGGGGAGGSGGGEGGSMDDAKRYLASVKSGELPSDPAVRQLAGRGLPPGPAALGVVYGRGGRGGAEKAADFASRCEQLVTMGFPLSLAAGALSRHGNDLGVATEACLALAS
ncbi:hypothetical protein Agub_g7992, partial [Astrephomene gubernaculifera]